MNILHIKFFFIMLTILGLGSTIFLATELWFVYVFIALFYLILWKKNKTNNSLIFPLFLLGLLGSFSAWFGSPWNSIIICCSATGLFLFQLNLIQQVRDLLLFLFFIILLITAGFISSLINRTYLPSLIIAGISVLIIFFMLFIEIRIQKKYIGDKK